MNKLFLIKSFPILLIISLFITACGGNQGSSNTKLDRKIKSFLNADNSISQDEWDELADMIANNSYSCDCDTDAGLQSYILQVAENRRNNPGTPEIKAEIADNTSSNSNTSDLQFKLYMESSASMYPYTTGRSDFKEAVYDLLTRVSSKSDEKGLINYIGKVIFPVDESVRDFINKRDPYDVAKKNKKKINTTNTDINDIIKLIFEADNKEAIHVLISDCIYSINNRDSRDGLAKVKYATKDIFQEHAKDYSLLALQLNSNYKGKYYPYSGGGVNIETDRPYYMLFIGTNKLINEILTNKTYSNIKNFESLEGFKNYHLFSATQSEDVHYSVLPTTEKIGRFRTDSDYSERSYVHGLKNVEAGKRDEVAQFSIAVDLSGVLVEESYKTNKSNYTIDADDDFLIEQITALDDFSRSDKGYVGSATHLITVSTDKVSQKKQSLKIGLKKVLPKWINDSSTDDDSKMKTDESIHNKTFGLEYMMEGINEGYHKNGEIHQHLTIKINIKK